MKTRKFSLGIDFGTESARAVLVDVSTGKEVATVVHQYRDGVIDRVLPRTKIKLEHDWALQNPGDWIETLKRAVPAVLRKAKVDSSDVIGIGIDFTSCTILPVTSEGTPLCMLKEFRNHPHGWAKLWKHHAAQPEADEINKLAHERGEEFIKRYGGRISSEWMFPKALQILREAPEIYRTAARIIEGGDWIVWQLTGNEKRSACQAGYKALWEKPAASGGRGYPSKEFLKALDPAFELFVDEKLSHDIYPIGSVAGELKSDMAKLTGLKEGTPVATAYIDAHSAVPGTSVTEPGKMVMVMGTSTCHMVLGREKVLAEGVAGVVEDGIIPGYFGYESGQSAVGDIFAWYVKNGVPADYLAEARKKKVDIHTLLEAKASRLKAGGSGLLALDWWNGNRSVLMDADLSGMMVGLTLSTKPEEIYRMLIEATAFGTRRIIEAHEQQNIMVNELYACGGLTKNRLLMQIYADVTGREISVAASSQATALGAAILGAVAAGKERGGYDNFQDASRKMAHVKKEKFVPGLDNKKIYDEIYAEYLTLHDYFGRRGNDVMKRLKAKRE